MLHEDEKQSIEIANETIHGFQERFQRHWLAGMRAKLGLFTEEAEDAALIQSLFEWMKETKADFTNTFRDLSHASSVPRDWHQRWQSRLSQQPQTKDEVLDMMCRNNPAFIPRNHLVEEALTAASEQGDLNPMQRLLTVLAAPYDHSSQVPPEFTKPAPAGCEPYQTFCGT